MKKFIFAAATLAMSLALTAPSLASAQTAQQMVGQRVVDQRYAELNSACSAKDHPYAGKSETQVKEALAGLTDRDIRAFVTDCKGHVAVAQNNVDVDVDVDVRPDRRPPAYVNRPHGRRGNYAKVRAYLKNYGGPLWDTRGQGPILNRYMNRRAPGTAVPCRPPGYNHTVLCDPH